MFFVLTTHGFIFCVSGNTVVFDSVIGTEKVRQAQDCKDLHVVNPDWLWSCLERWDKVEEQLFPLKDDYIKTHRYVLFLEGIGAMKTGYSYSNADLLINWLLASAEWCVMLMGSIEELPGFVHFSFA